MKRVIRSNYSHMVAEQCGFAARKVGHAEVAENEQKVKEPSAGMLVEQNLVADGFEKAVGCRRAMGRVINGVEQKRKLMKKEQLGSLVTECVAKVEDELWKRIQESQPVAEAGKSFFYLPLMNDGDKMDKDPLKKSNEFINVSILEDQRNGNVNAGLWQREELVNEFEYEKFNEGNLEQIGNVDTGEIDQSVELQCAREGGQLVNRRKIESRKGFSGDEAGETARIQESRSQEIGVRKGPEPKWNIERSPQSSQVRQIWLTMDRKTRVVDLGEETGEEMEQKVRRWMRVEREIGLYVICEGKRLSWEELSELRDGKTAEVMMEFKGGMGRKKSRKNPWLTPSQSSTGSEPEMIWTETGGDQVKQRNDEKLQEVLEKKVQEALEEGRVLDKLVEGLAVM